MPKNVRSAFQNPFNVTFPEGSMVTEDYDAEVDAFAAQLAKMYHAHLIDNIKSNKFGFTHKPSTEKRSGAHTPMFDTGAYVDSIKVNGAEVYVDNGKEGRSGISFVELSYLLEYGRKDKHMKAFPVWRKTLEELKPRFEKAFEMFMKNKIFNP